MISHFQGKKPCYSHTFSLKATKGGTTVRRELSPEERVACRKQLQAKKNGKHKGMPKYILIINL